LWLQTQFCFHLDESPKILASKIDSNLHKLVILQALLKYIFLRWLYFNILKIFLRDLLDVAFGTQTNKQISKTNFQIIVGGTQLNSGFICMDYLYLWL
jgi:hypothetical protein